MEQPKEGTLRIWHISNPPNDGYKQVVESVEKAIAVLNTIASYDLYLGDLIGSNAQGLEVFECGEWTEYYDDEGRDIRQITDLYRPALEIQTRTEAQKYFTALVNRRREVSPEIDFREACDMERSNLGYYAGYGSSETRERVERLFDCNHPVFGSVTEDGEVTAAVAFEAGVEEGENNFPSKEHKPVSGKQVLRTITHGVPIETAFQMEKLPDGYYELISDIGDKSLAVKGKGVFCTQHLTINGNIIQAIYEPADMMNHFASYKTIPLF